MYILVGCWCSGDAIQPVQCYDPQQNDGRMVAPMSEHRCGIVVAVLSDLFIAVGAHYEQTYLNSIER